MPGVSAWLTSRIGTRSGPTYTLREFGSGLIAAASTWAVVARNFGLAFMAFPTAGLPASGSKGLSHPPPDCRDGTPTQGPIIIPPPHEPRTSPHQHGRAADPHLGGARPGRAGSALCRAARGVRAAAAPRTRLLRPRDSAGRRPARRAHVATEARG